MNVGTKNYKVIFIMQVHGFQVIYIHGKEDRTQSNITKKGKQIHPEDKV